MHNRVQSSDLKASQYEGQISVLQEQPIGLTNELASLESQLAPIWTVPPEILSYIFELAHQEELKTPADSRDCPNTSFPIKISYVSRLFRDIAVNTSTLWTVIHVHDVRGMPLDHVRTYLEHSANSPLSISLHLFRRKYSEPAIVQMMSHIQANLYRLRQLKAAFDSPDISLLVTRHLNRPAPQLTTLHLSDFTSPGAIFNHVANNPDPPGPAFLGNELDKLTDLQLSTVPIPWPQCNFENLVVFRLHGYTRTLSIPYQKFWAIIENSPSLRMLSFDNSAFLLSEWNPEPEVRKPCVLNSLEGLQLSMLSLTVSLMLLSRLHAPNLQALTLLYIKQGDDLLNLVAGPPVLFPNLALLQIDGVFANDKEAVVNRLHQAYPRLRGWDSSSQHSAISLVGIDEKYTPAGPFQAEDSEPLYPARVSAL